MSLPSHSEQPDQTGFPENGTLLRFVPIPFLGWECHETAALVWPKVSASVLMGSGEHVSPRAQGGHVRVLRLCEIRRGVLLGVPALSRDSL